MFQIRVTVLYGGFKIRVKFHMPGRSRGTLNSHEDFDTLMEQDDEHLKQLLLLRNLPLSKWYL